jgi:hypothetical protein
VISQLGSDVGRNSDGFSQAQKGTAEPLDLSVLPFDNCISQDLSVFS